MNFQSIGITGIEKEGLQFKGIVKEFKIEDILKIPKEKPVITELTHVAISLENIETEVFDTIRGVNYEGFFLTGKKIFISGTVVTNYKYSTNHYIKTIHNIKFETPFSTYVTLDEEFIDKDDFSTHVYVEDIKVRTLDDKKICQHILILVNFDNF